ncbi:MAG TPA: tRNA preQ1(34) S-adenosylmethionine ribosyltransferase-isomerase QueA [Burkholderiaceae bacterium]|jgi:S-adenosylmethionine:tRNA ribosyltransferase-isomerase|nr:tRNA preQ1(34) S-adenosylmethionine ribosyltransferase-isomerase QueA [Burkholderiaceae bacterium]
MSTASTLHTDPELTLADFDFDLPGELIAQHPLADRAGSRLLHVTEKLADRSFTDIASLLRADDLLVFNDTKVINARLLGRKPSGGKVEALIERVLEPTLALAMVRTSHTPVRGTHLIFDDVVHATVEGRQQDFFLLRFDRDVQTVLARHGLVPLPPYIEHAADSIDALRYQTVYATRPGAVAAPTAGLHFTEDLLIRLRERGIEFAHVTLHVGAGTFQPVRVERIADHRMHAERYEISEPAANAINAARDAGRRIVAVGTTSLRALESATEESAAQVRSGVRETVLFVTPGFRFRVVDLLLTNFHLPKSTLLMLVSAFAGLDCIRAAYAHAIAQRYRFFSYGDAMLLERAC